MRHNLLSIITLCAIYSLGSFWAETLFAQEIVPITLPAPVASTPPGVEASTQDPPATSAAAIPVTTLNVTTSPDGSTIHTFGAGTPAEWTVTISPGISSAPVRRSSPAMLPPSPSPSTNPVGSAPTAASTETTCPDGDCQPALASSDTLQGVVRAQYYTEVYNQIPFSRAEYDANPSYRHDAAIELLLGQIRPVTRQTTNVNVTTGGFDPWTNYYRGFWGAPFGYQPFGYYAPRYRTYVRW